MLEQTKQDLGKVRLVIIGKPLCEVHYERQPDETWKQRIYEAGHIQPMNIIAQVSKTYVARMIIDALEKHQGVSYYG